MDGTSRSTNRFALLDNCTYETGNDMLFSGDQEDESETVSEISTSDIPHTSLPPSIRVLSEDPTSVNYIGCPYKEGQTGSNPLPMMARFALMSIDLFYVDLATGSTQEFQYSSY